MLGRTLAHFIRALSRRRAEDETLADGLQAQRIPPTDPPRGNLYAALRRSPLVGTELGLTRQTPEPQPHPASRAPHSPAL